MQLKATYASDLYPPAAISQDLCTPSKRFISVEGAETMKS